MNIISFDDITTVEISDALYMHDDFTLTVNAVNDAPIVLHPLEYLAILENPRDAAMVLTPMYFN